jgi:hypothetical protein
LGLSGLFALLSALVLPFIRRQPGPRRPGVAHIGMLAVVVSVAVVVVWDAFAEIYRRVADPSGTGGPAHLATLNGRTGRAVLRFPIIALTLMILIALLLVGEGLFRLRGVRPTPLPPPIARPPQSADQAGGGRG